MSTLSGFQQKHHSLAPGSSSWSSQHAAAGTGVIVGATATLLGLLIAQTPLGGVAFVVSAGVVSFLAIYDRMAAAIIAICVLAAVPIIDGIAIDQGGLPSFVRKVPDGIDAVGVVLLLLRRDRCVGRANRYLTGAVGLWVLSASVGFISRYNSPSLDLTVFGQELRWVGVIGWGLTLSGELVPRKRLLWSYWLLVGWNLANVGTALVELRTGELFAARLGVQVAPGVFGHPTSSAIASSMLLVAVFSDRVSRTPRLGGRRAAGATIVAVLGIVLSARFKVVLVLGAPLLVFGVLRVCGSRRLAVGAVMLIPLAGALALPKLSAYAQDATQPGILPNAAAHANTRVLLLNGAVRLANQSFPFGRGLGTYGSGDNADVEGQAVGDAGLGSVFGFAVNGSEDYLSDSYIAHALGERGYIGLGIWLAAVGLLFVFFLEASPDNFFGAAAVVAIAAVAPVSSTVFSVGVGWLALLPAATLIPAARRRREVTRPGDRDPRHFGPAGQAAEVA